MTGTHALAPAADSAPQLVADLEDDSSDSAYAGSIAGTETTSLQSAVTRYRQENGRTYHAYGSTEHWGPNDEKAQDQQDLSHHLWGLALKGEHYIAPISHPQRILDLGTGTGIWVIEVAERHPDAVVHGIDLSPIQPTWLPPNAIFLVDDYNADWIDVEKYDLIHARELLGTVPDWVTLYKNALKYIPEKGKLSACTLTASRALRPGGWFDQAEPSLFFTTDHHQLDEKHPFTQWGEMMVEAGHKVGMRFDIGAHIKEWMEEAGFVNVKEIRQPWTIGGWAKDRHLREIGQWNQVRLDEGVKDFCSRRFTNQMGASSEPSSFCYMTNATKLKPEEIEIFCMDLRAAFRRKKFYGYQWA